MNEPHAIMNDRLPAVAAKPRRSVFDWLSARREMARASKLDAAISAHSRAALKRAELAFELARDEQLQSEPGMPLALELFRQSTYWALCAADSSLRQATPEQAWVSSERGQLAALNLKATELADGRALLRSNFTELAEYSPAQQHESLTLIERVADQLITEARSRESQLGRVHVLRFARLLLVVGPVCALLSGLAFRHYRDLAAGAPWSTSSSLFECHPEHSECGGVSTKIRFHTKEDASPWFRYDFGKTLEFSAVTIRNRSDYRPELAVPLVVEISDDDSHYREVARREEVFATWRASFGAQRARYLRVRALHKTYLHLEAIEVHP